MNRLVISAIFIFASFFANSSQAEFTHGNQYAYSNIDGSLSVRCGSSTKTIVCRDVFLDPWPYDIFLGPQNNRATQVELEATAQGRTQKTMVAYDGVSGRSSEVNLGVYSLFQRPLLKVGTNQIQYKLLSAAGDALASGQFSVTVTRGKNRTCESKSVTSADPNDCDRPYTICQLYFRNLNYCR